MTLTYEGKFGIGKTDPTAKLEVTGLTSTTDVFVTDDVQVGGNISINGNLLYLELVLQLLQIQFMLV